jgi:UDP-N-acetylglucosamine:LPS N-acetylglucosamine transferase
LTGGHQLKNAEAYEKAEAVRVVTEDALQQDTEVLFQVISDLLDSPEARRKLGQGLYGFAHAHAAHELANLLLAQTEVKAGGPEREV